MLIPFDDMPTQARAWVYQTNRSLTEVEELEMSGNLEKFMLQWAAHNQPLKASFKFIHHHFLVILVDESFNQASGCTIDASVHLVNQLEQNFGVDFFDRMKVAFFDGENVFLESISNLKASIAEGKVTEQTFTFNNLVKDKEELQSQWMVPAAQSWLKRYFQAVEQH